MKKELLVKTKLIPSLLAIFAVMLSVSAFAKDTHSGSFNLSDTVRIGSAELAPGHYKAEWSGPKDAVKVNIVQNGKVVLTTDAQLKDLPQRAPYDAVLLKTRNDNTKQVDEIDFNHRSEALHFAD